MASCCCWFIQPAIAMRTNRKGSRTFVVLACKGYYAPGGRSVRLQIFQQDRISGRNEIAGLRAGVVTPYGLEFLAESKAVEAIPALEERFGLVSDDLDKGKIAQVLIRLKDPKLVYWAYLEKLVRSALDSDPPDPFDVDAQGRETGISPRIEEWARATRQAPPAALEKATAVYPAYVVLLGGGRRIGEPFRCSTGRCSRAII